MKRQLTDWEKIFTNDATSKGLISKIYSSYNSVSKNKHPNLKMSKDLNRPFFKEDVQMATGT